MAGNSILYIAVDRQNKKVVSYNGSVGSIPDFFQTNTITLQVQVLDPTGIQFAPNNPNAAYNIVDVSAYGLRASVGQTPQVSGGPNPLALQNAFTWDAVNKWFFGDLALNTAAVDTFLGSLPSAQAYFELNLTPNGNRVTILQTTFNLKACVDETATTAPNPGNVYLTKADIGPYIMQWLAQAGIQITLTSPNGAHKRILGCNNDGSALDDLI